MCIFKHLVCGSVTMMLTMMAGFHILVLLKRKMGNQLERSGVVLATWNSKCYKIPLVGKSELRQETPRRNKCPWCGPVGSPQLGDLLRMASG